MLRNVAGACRTALTTSAAMQAVLYSIDETYPKSGAGVRHKRRDLRSGELVGRFEVSEDGCPSIMCAPTSIHALPGIASHSLDEVLVAFLVALYRINKGSPPLAVIGAGSVGTALT